MRAQRWIAVVCLSLVLHAAAWWLFRQQPAPTPPPPPRLVAFDIVTIPTKTFVPPPAAPKKKTAPRRQRKSAVRRRIVEPVKPQPPTAPAPSAEPSARAPGLGPRRAPDLFAPGALAAASQPTAPLAGSALAQHRLDAWARAVVAYNKPEVTELTPGVTHLGQRLSDWFKPPESSLDAHIVGPSFRDALPDVVALQADKALPETLQRAERRAGMAADTPAIGLCFGNCDQPTHLVARLRTLVDIDHAPSGLPDRWSVAASSGDQDFDARALLAVKDAAPWLPKALPESEKKPAWSRWEFAIEARRWRRHELILDPQFQPAGEVLDAQSGLGRKTTVEREVRLVAVRYQGEQKEK